MAVAFSAVAEVPVTEGSTAPPPEHVRSAFGVRDAEPELLDRPALWRCGDVLIKPAESTVHAGWVAQSLDTLQADGLRLARPLRSSDGRWVVSGWTASRHLEGRAEPRYDEVVAVAQRLHAATAGLSRPGFLDGRFDLYATAEAAAWGEIDPKLSDHQGGDAFTELAAARRPLDLRPQVVHGELFGNVLFAGSAPPAVLGFMPYWRPPEWAAAVVVVDALAWGGADPGLMHRWSSLPEWPQALLRALLFRIAVHALHPHAGEQSLAGLHRAVGLVRQLL